MGYLDLKEAENPSTHILGDFSDEDLFKELHTCCNPNCLTIMEVKRRYEVLKKLLSDKARKARDV